MLTVAVLFALVLSANSVVWNSVGIGGQSTGFLKKWVEMRTGAGRAVWHHKGVMRSSLSGEEIAGVEGLEWISLVSWSPMRYVSKKIFVMVDKHNSSHPLTAFRKQRAAPERPMNPVKIINEMVTLNSHDHDILNTTITMPGGRIIHSRRATLEQKGKGLELRHVASFVPKANPISKWISFSSPANSGGGRSQEQYDIRDRTPMTWTNFFKRVPSVIMSYRRFGESPAWYAVGRGSMVEMTAVRYPDLNAVPTHIRTFFEDVAADEMVKNYDLIKFSSAKDPLSDFLSWHHMIMKYFRR